jgi:sporulation protein YlmC with PRC-barrel domain
MSSSVLGRDAVIQIDGTDVGCCKGVTVSISADVIKEYFISNSNPDRPAVLESGNKTFEVSIERAWIDKTYAEKVLGGTAVDIIVRPEGTGSGKTEITLSDVILTGDEISMTQDGIVMESISGEAKDITIGTQA